jgi:hypothetical protein
LSEHPRAYASYHDVLDDKVCILKNDLGEKLTVTRDAAGDVAIMLAEFCDDSDLCEFVADEWRGRGWELEEDEEEQLEEEEVDPDDQTMVDLGGGMVVPLSEVMDDD